MRLEKQKVYEIDSDFGICYRLEFRQGSRFSYRLEKTNNYSGYTKVLGIKPKVPWRS